MHNLAPPAVTPQDFPRPHSVKQADLQRTLSVVKGERTDDAAFLCVGPFHLPLLSWQQEMVDDFRAEAKRQELPTIETTKDGWYTLSVKVN